jgi:hypothetical protein
MLHRAGQGSRVSGLEIGSLVETNPLVAIGGKHAIEGEHVEMEVGVADSSATNRQVRGKPEERERGRRRPDLRETPAAPSAAPGPPAPGAETPGRRRSRDR